jgi:hypothetical protein
VSSVERRVRAEVAGPARPGGSTSFVTRRTWIFRPALPGLVRVRNPCSDGGQPVSCGGQDDGLLAKRHQVYLAARRRRPERWSRATRNGSPVETVVLDPERRTHDLARAR